MRISSPICALVVGLSASVALAACNGPMPNDVTLPASATPVSLSADPNPIIPEFITQSGCFGSQPFGLRFLLAIGSPPHVAFRQIRLGFRDRFGGHFLPVAVTGTAGQQFRNVGPIPFPSPLSNGATIPFPSTTPLMATVSAVGSSRPLGVSMSFPCGVEASGTLIIIGDFDDHGRSRSTEVRVRVGN